MIPVDQTTFGFPGGNCFSACVASILEVPIEAVPYFMHTDDDPDGEQWWDRFLDWLRPLGFWAVGFNLSPDWKPEPGAWCILGGVSPRARAGHEDVDLHVVVGRGLEVVHDPHPDRTGLTGKPHDAILLIPFDPSKVVVHCRTCNRPVPPARHGFSHPACYECIPPPPPMPSGHAKRVTIDLVIASVSEELGVPGTMIRGPRRVPNVVRARHVAMYLARRITQASYPAIARALGGRHHTTVIQGVTRVARQIHTDSELREQVLRLQERILAGENRLENDSPA